MKKFKRKPDRDSSLSHASYFNIYAHNQAIKILEDKLPSGPTAQDDFGQTAKGGRGRYSFEGGFFTFPTDTSISLGKGKATTFESGTKYDPFTILTRIQFGGNVQAASHYVQTRLRKLTGDYVRVGTDYFKKITVEDRFGVERSELKRWKKDEIKEDGGKAALSDVLKYDTFVMEPNNLEYDPAPKGAYNLYHQFSHKPATSPKAFPWTEELLRNVFGDQYELGLQYMKTLYFHPKQALPILVLASVERITGKTTFLNWVHQLFGANYTVINPEDVVNSFNGSYALKNIIAIEETKDDRTTTTNKLKNLSTTKSISVNQKYIDHYNVPFFGKFIITTNEPERFLKIDAEEVRLWVRILKPPAKPKANIEDLLVDEIPAFLRHLHDMPSVDMSKSRMVFTADEINTEALDKVKVESRSEVHKDILVNVDEYFAAHPDRGSIDLTVGDIRTLFFGNNHRFGLHYIGRVLKDEMGMTPSLKYYNPIIHETITNSFIVSGDQKKGSVYTFINPFNEFM